MEILRNKRWYPFLIITIAELVAGCLLTFIYRNSSEYGIVFRLMEFVLFMSIGLLAEFVERSSTKEIRHSGKRRNHRHHKRVLGTKVIVYAIILSILFLYFFLRTRFANPLDDPSFFRPLIIFGVFYLNYKDKKTSAVICASSLLIHGLIDFFARGLWLFAEHVAYFEALSEAFSEDFSQIRSLPFWHFIGRRLLLNTRAIYDILLLVYVLCGRNRISDPFVVISSIFCIVDVIMVERGFVYSIDLLSALQSIAGFLIVKPRFFIVMRRKEVSNNYPYLEKYKKEHGL